jgi:hypothetical protein
MFCGDTFDLVEKWPSSKLARYSRYWSGRYLQTVKRESNGGPRLRAARGALAEALCRRSRGDPDAGGVSGREGVAVKNAPRCP